MTFADRLTASLPANVGIKANTSSDFADFLKTEPHGAILQVPDESRRVWHNESIHSVHERSRYLRTLLRTLHSTNDSAKTVLWSSERRCHYSIHPIPPTHFFLLDVLHCKHSLPAPTSTIAHIPHTILPQDRQPNSAPLTSSPSIPPIVTSASGWSNATSQSSQVSTDEGTLSTESSRRGAGEEIDQKVCRECCR